MKKTILASVFALTASAALAQVPMPGGASAPTMPTMPAMPGSADQQAQMATMMAQAAHNQLGVLEFCHDKGAVGDDVVALQKKVLGMLPAPASTDGLDQAEAAGKQGKVVFAGNTVPLSDAAQQKGTTVDAMCKQMGSMLLAQAGNLPK